LFDIFTALDELWKKFIGVKLVNTENVAEHPKLLTSKGSRKIVKIVQVHDGHVIFYSISERANVILFVFLQLADDVEELC
jgi:hypothetical protein